MSFDLFGNSLTKPRARRQGATGRTKAVPELGCAYCPMDKVEGINKVINIEQVRGRRGMIWAQSPGGNENAECRELIGASGQLLWKTLEEVTRSFEKPVTRLSVDIQNVMRCRPADEYGEEHVPTRQELHCCSIYNQQAVDQIRQRAAVHLVLGKIAAEQLRKQFKIGPGMIVWHEDWNAYVMFAPHPSYFLRGGGKKDEEGKGWTFNTFKDLLRQFGYQLRSPHRGRWSYVMNQDYGAIHEARDLEVIEDYIHDEAREGRRVSLDIEDGTVDGVPRVLLVGFGWGQFAFSERGASTWYGGARSVVLYHPEADQSPRRLKEIEPRLRRLIESTKIRKVMQHGGYDDLKIQELMGYRVGGYDADSQYMVYLRHSTKRSYGLKTLITDYLPEFQDYKDTIVAEWVPNYANAPLSRLVPYNCADCDVTKRIEARFMRHTRKKGDPPQKGAISQPLLEVYIHAAYTLDAMEKRGPYLDIDIWAKVKPILEEKIEASRRNLLRVAEEVGYEGEYTPGVPARDAKLVFDYLGLPELANRSTKKDVMELIGLQSGSPVPKLILEHRVLTHMYSHNIIGYRKSADTNHGILKTIWWLCGAATGRLRSGRSDRAAAEGVVNFQNIPNIPLVQSMIVSDPNWRKALEE